MSKLEQLIKEKCPNGVIYKSIKDFAWTGIGLATSVTKYKRPSGVILLHNSDIKQNKIELKNIEFLDDDFVNKNKNKIHKLHDIITVHTGDVGTSAVIEKEYVGSVGFTTIITRIHDFEKIDPYYLSHYFNSNIFKQKVNRKTISERNNLNQSDFENIEVPVPPLEVQREIVEILDKFTILSAEISAEISAELSARKVQFNSFCLKLFSSLKCEYKRIDSFAERIAGATPNTSKSEYWLDGNIPWMSSGEVSKGNVYITEKCITKLGYDNCSARLVPANTVVIALAGQGKTRGTVAITRIKLCTNQSLCSLVTDNSVNSEYLYYYLKTQYSKLREISSGNSNRGGLNLKMIGSYLVPVPSIDKQNRIVDILKRFDLLCNDISSDLTAEIEARQKQYEYYRDRLLTFKKLKYNASL